VIDWLSVDELVAVPPPPKWIVEGLQLCPGRVSMIYGEKGSAKSLVTCAAAVAVAAGLPVWGAFAVDAPKVAAIVDYEMGLGPLRRRVHGCARGLGISLRALQGRLLVTSRPPKLDLTSTPAIVESFRGISFAVIDTFAGATPNVDKNDERIRAWIDPMSAASEEIGTTFLLVHHEGKGSRRARGSSAIEDACGAVFRISGTDDKRPRHLVQTKVAVDAAEPIDAMSLLVQKTDCGGCRVLVEGHRAVDPERALPRVADVVATLAAWTGPRLPSKTELAKAMGGKKETALAAIDLAEERQLIGSQASGTARRFQLSGTAQRSAGE
jgi:hypothetical protein